MLRLPFKTHKYADVGNNQHLLFTHILISPSLDCVHVQCTCYSLGVLNNRAKLNNKKIKTVWRLENSTCENFRYTTN